MPDHLDALRERWAIKVHFGPTERWTAMGSRHSGRRLTAMFSVWDDDRATAEADLLAACAAADDLPTKRERVLEEALRFVAGEYGIDLTALPFEIALTPTKEAPGGE